MKHIDETLEEFMERCYREGQAFEVYLTITASTDRVTFSLDTSNWDWDGDAVAETTPFLNKEFIITGMKMEITDTSKNFVFQDILFDGIEATPLDWFGLAPGASVVIAWDGIQKGATDFRWPKVTDHYGAPIVVRHSIAVKASTCGGSDSAIIRIRGYALDRHY